MKKTVLFALHCIALVMSFLVFGCDTGNCPGVETNGDEIVEPTNDPVSKNGFIGLTISKEYDAVNGDGTARTYDKCVSFFWDESSTLAAVFSGSPHNVSIGTNNKITLEIGPPANSELYPPTNIDPVFVSSTGLKIYELYGFRYGSKPAPSIYWAHETVPDNTVLFIYANQDGTISGTGTYAESFPLTLDMELKQGWNTAILTISSTITIVTGTPSSSYKWQIGIDD
ncbi:hypothetical protein AGMMS49942_16640 [Spirochaetia bacterium]|nr:hypothetical protein AGMMS49942_16640 [Spirochaetia bacterium]